jgi:hypothetical protein
MPAMEFLLAHTSSTYIQQQTYIIRVVNCSTMKTALILSCFFASATAFGKLFWEGEKEELDFVA